MSKNDANCLPIAKVSALLYKSGSLILM